MPLLKTSRRALNKERNHFIFHLQKSWLVNLKHYF